MKKSIILPVLACCFCITSCDLLGLGEEKASPKIKDFVWKIDTLNTSNVTFDQRISGETINELWIANGTLDSGLLKLNNGKFYTSSTNEHVGSIIFYKDRYYGGGYYNLNYLKFNKDFKLESVESVLNIERLEKDYKLGKITDIVSGYDNTLYLLCTYENEELMPSYTTVVKWDGSSSSLVFTSEWGVQGHEIFLGRNGMYFQAVKIDYEGTLVKYSYDAIGSIENDTKKLFVVGQREADVLSLGMIGEEVYLKYNQELHALREGNTSPTGLTFPANTYVFAGYSKDNMIAAGLTGHLVFDGTTWSEIKMPAVFNSENRVNSPTLKLLEDGIATVVTQRPPTGTFYLIRGFSN